MKIFDKYTLVCCVRLLLFLQIKTVSLYAMVASVQDIQHQQLINNQYRIYVIIQDKIGYKYWSQLAWERLAVVVATLFCSSQQRCRYSLNETLINVSVERR